MKNVFLLDANWLLKLQPRAMCGKLDLLLCWLHVLTRGQNLTPICQKQNDVLKEQIQWEHSLKSIGKNNTKGNESENNLTLSLN